MRRRLKEKERIKTADEVPALKEELDILRALLRNRETIIDDLQRSKDAKVTKGFFETYSHAENVPGLKECLVIIRNGVPNVHALIAEINSVYCNEKQGLTSRTTFGTDLQARVGERFCGRLRNAMHMAWGSPHKLMPLLNLWRRGFTVAS